jgi:rhamnosyltransferase
LTFFCSNAWSAWSNHAQDAVGFSQALSDEDAITAAKLVRSGHRVTYIADAAVEHSHPESLRADFRRGFDATYARGMDSDLMRVGAGYERIAAEYATRHRAHLAREQPLRIPHAVLHLTDRWLGWLVGRPADRLPLRLRARLEGHPRYWNMAQPTSADR